MEEETKVLTTPWLYAGLKYRERLLILNKHTSSTANLNGILECCSVVFGVSRDDITGSCRKQEFAIDKNEIKIDENEPIIRDKRSKTT